MALLEVVPFTFDEIKQFMVDKFKDKGYNADFQGSNASIMADMMSYVVSHMNTNTAFNIGEMLLTTATRTESVLNLARQQGYEAQGIVSYQYKITLRMKPDESLAPNNTQKRIYEISRHSKFTSGTKSYYYIGDTLTFQVSNNEINNLGQGFVTIYVKEGTLYKFSEYPDSLSVTIPSIRTPDGEIETASYIDIPFTEVEDDGVEVYLTYVDEFGVVQSDEEWTRTKQFLLDKDAVLNRKFFRLDNIKLKTPRIYFSIAGVGSILRANTDIDINVLVSSGSKGEATGIMNVSSPLSETFALYDGTDADKQQTLMIVGQDLEDKELIRENAPLFHNSANRAVTKYDYQSIVNRQNVTKYSQVWGGEVEIPVKLGYVYVSVVPNRLTNEFLSDTYKYNFDLIDADNITNLFLQTEEYRNSSLNGVFDILDEFSVITIQKQSRNPVYIDFNFTAKVVRYNRTLPKGDVHQSVFDVAKTYFDRYIAKSEAEYFHSNVIKRIDTVLTDASGVVLNLDMDINIYPENVEFSLTDVASEKIFTCYLALPYESYIDTDMNIKTSILPNIDTVEFLPAKDLVVDFDNLHLALPSVDVAMNPYIFYDILVDGVVCGRYMIVQGSVRYIRIDLFISVSGGTPENPEWIASDLSTEDFLEIRKLKLDYYADSMKFFKNSFPRLRSFTFQI